ncbi:MAG: serpin family protein [Planctomycetes bacterium]|nr:serpin family protein [Planctomycetota bacterium]
MRRAASLLSILISGSAFLAGCAEDHHQAPPADPFEVRKIPQDIAADVAALVAGNNRFGIDLYHELREGSDGNLFFSPFSVSAALAMTYAGAAGETKEEMAAVLRLPDGGDDVHRSFGALIASIDRGSGLGAYELTVAGRLWGQVGYAFLDRFLFICRDDYGADLALLDFARDPDAARGIINQWVEDETAGRIVGILPQGSVDSWTRMILTNAIYFKGDWASRFAPSATMDRPFHLTASGAVPVPTMSQIDDFRFYVGDGIWALEMPYEAGDLSMIVILSDAWDGLPALEAAFTHENLERWIASLRTGEVHVSLPRFQFTSTFGLKAPLSALGMPSAFDANLADFSAMDGTRNLHLQGVAHKAYVRVDEEGSEAAAATAVKVGTTSGPPMFCADHPFLFLIRDNVTGSILFLGRVVNPLLPE